MEISDALSQNMFGFISALIGGVVGGYFTLKATDKAIRTENEKENRQEEKEVQNLLDSLGVELDTLWSFHMRRIGAMVEALTPDKALEFNYPLTQDYFTVYNTNAGKIGCIKEPELRKAIVVCYNKAKKVVDGFKYNNELFIEYNRFKADAVRAKENFAALAAYGQIIREDHFELKEYIEDLLNLLDKRQK